MSDEPEPEAEGWSAGPGPVSRMAREATEIEAAILLVASGRAVSVTVTDVPDAGAVIAQFELWASELGVELVELEAPDTSPAGPEAVLVRRRR